MGTRFDAPFVVIAIALLGEPIGSSVLAFLVLGEIPDPPLYLGAAIILGGIALAIWPRKRSVDVATG